jgi:hypothetical protein
MIIMFLNGCVRPPDNKEADIIKDNQSGIMLFMLITALVCPIAMLVCKPVFLHFCRRNKHVKDDDDFVEASNDSDFH